MLSLTKTLANHFEFKGKPEIVYGLDWGGNPHLMYDGQSYMGPDLNHTHAGTLVSVLIDFVADGYSRYLCLLIPPVNLSTPDEVAEVETYAIFATHKTSIAGPVLIKGQWITYDVKQLTGETRLLVS